MKINDILSAADVMELMLDAVCVVDESGCFVFVSAAFENLFGYKAKEVIGKAVIDYVHPEDRARTLATVNKLLSNNIQPSFENRWMHKSGHIVHVLWSVRWSKQHKVRVAVAHDISARKQMETELKFIASHDSLTQLPNRALLKERLEITLSDAAQSGSNFALLFIDINGFKAVNDTHGHLLGDEVLTVVAKRLSHCVRKTDTVGRLSGDEFLILINDIESEQDVAVLTEKIRQEIEHPMVFSNSIVNVSLSVGVALYPKDATQSESLIQHADKAMYLAKKAAEK